VTAGALFFVKPVREKNYVTIMDPFQEKYGNTLTAILFVPSLLADIFWIACVLAALGKSVVLSAK
jgi:high affinity choline transporter 7